MKQGVRQGCALLPLMFNILGAAVITVALQRFSTGTGVLAKHVHLDEAVPQEVGDKHGGSVREEDGALTMLVLCFVPLSPHRV